MLDFGFYNLDCMEGMKEFPDDYFDLAIVDPPYGSGFTEGGGCGGWFTKYREENVGGGMGVVINNQQKTDNLRIRKLTPKECWRLMGFDDADFEKAEKVNSNTQLYKQAGNSIVVNVLEAILSSLFLEDNKEKQMTIFELMKGD